MNLQVVHPQLAAGDDRRAADLNPAAVEVGFIEQAGGLLRLDQLVVCHVEELDDLPLDEDDPWDPYRCPEAARDALGHAGLSIARIAVEKKAAARVDCGTEQPERFLGDQQIGKRAPQVFLLGTLVHDRLSGHRREIVVEWNGGGSNVGAFLRVHPGPRPPGVGQRIHIVIRRCRVGVRQELLVLEDAQELRKRPKRQAQLGCDSSPRGHAAVDQEFEDQPFDDRRVKSRLLKIFDRLRVVRVFSVQARYSRMRSMGCENHVKALDPFPPALTRSVRSPGRGNLRATLGHCHKSVNAGSGLSRMPADQPDRRSPRSTRWTTRLELTESLVRWDRV